MTFKNAYSNTYDFTKCENKNILNDDYIIWKS